MNFKQVFFAGTACLGLGLAGCPAQKSPSSPSANSPTPTRTITATATVSTTPTLSASATASRTLTPTLTTTGTLTATPSASPTSTPSMTPSTTASRTPTASPTSTATNPPTSTPTNSPSPNVTVQSNQTIPTHPHAIDYYIPSNPTSAIIFLHGGGGKKEGFAYSLGIKNDDLTTDYDLSPSGKSWLLANRVVAVFPQGQAIASNPNAWTWDNHVMISGVDDVGFLQDLVASMKADPAFSSVTKFYLAGHSNGGMMANRMWCESPATFDAYGALAGPPSSHLDPTLGSSPCNPGVVKPYIGVIGDSDTCLATTGNMGAVRWYGNPVLVLVSSAAWVDPPVFPRYLNEVNFQGNRAGWKCAEALATPVTSGLVDTYSNCSGTLQLLVVHQEIVATLPVGGDHCLTDLSGPCVTTLVGNTGLDLKTVLFDFFKNF